MNRIIMSIMVALCLTACGEESKEKNNDKAVKTTYKLYAIDGFTGEYDINELLLFSAIYSNGKAYTFDEQNDEMSKFEKQMWNFRPLNMIIFKNLYQLYKYNKHTIISIIFNFI